MAATGTPTPNIGLRRPQGTDPASVDDINYNSALIDTKLGAVGNSSVQDQIDTLNGKLTTPTNITGITSFSDVTINDSHFYKIGNTVFGYARFTVSQTINEGNYVIGGLPRGVTTLSNGNSFATCSTNRFDTSFAIVNYGNYANIVNVGSISARRYIVSFIYQGE